MTRARDTAGIIQYSNLTIDSNNAVGIGSSQPDTQLDVNGGVRVTGIITAANLEVTSDATITGNLTVQGTTVTLDTIVQEVDLINIQANSTTPAIGVTQSGSGAIAAFYDGAVGVATFKDGGGLDVAGNVVATAFVGSGANLTDVISGIGITGGASGGAFNTNLGTGLTAINFSGATVEYHEATGLSTITIQSGGITTTASAPSANTIIYLDLSSAQYHELALSAGITTISCTGGTVGDSHTVIVNQPSSGIATVGFDTYFKFPSGADPSMTEGGSAIDLVSFVVKKVAGVGGTELLASAGLNYQ